MKKWSCTLKGKDISNKVLYVIIASPGFFLLVNEYPLFAIVSNMVVLALGIFFYFYRGSVSREHYGTLGILLRAFRENRCNLEELFQILEKISLESSLYVTEDLLELVKIAAKEFNNYRSEK